MCLVIEITTIPLVSTIYCTLMTLIMLPNLIIYYNLLPKVRIILITNLPQEILTDVFQC